MKDLRAKMDPDTGNFPAGVEEDYRKMDADYQRLTDQIRDAEAFEAREKEMAEAEYIQRHTQRSPQNTSTTADAQKLTYDDVYWRYLCRGIEGLNAEEKRMLHTRYDQAETRGTDPQITTTDSAGGFLVPTSFSNEIDAKMKWYGSILAACTIFDDPIGGTLEWPSVDDTSNTGTIQTTEASQIAVQDMTFGQVLFGHHTFTSGIVQVSRQLVQDERVSLLRSVLSDALSERLGRNINAKLTTGTGTNQPYGIVTVSSQGKEAASQTAFTKAELIDLQHSVDKAYRDNPRSAWMMNDAILAAARKLDVGNTDTVQIFYPGLAAGEPDRLLGKPVWINNDMAATQAQSAKIILFGDFDKYKIRRISPVSIERNDTLYWDYLKVGFMGWTRLDGNLITAGAIKYLQNKTT